MGLSKFKMGQCKFQIGLSKFRMELSSLTVEKHLKIFVCLLKTIIYQKQDLELK